MPKTEFMTMLRCTRHDFDILDAEEAIILAGFGEVAVEAFTSRHLQVPEWLLGQNKALERFIKVKTEEELEMRLKRAEARRATLMTPTEQRELLDQEIAALRTALGGPTA